jgi:hypothetical protein
MNNEIIINEMLQQIHNKLKIHKLQEGFKSKDDFDVSKIVTPGSISKWEGKPAAVIITAAKEQHDKSALEYIFWKMKGAITNTFWKKYLGPNGAMRKYRIVTEDAWEQWLGIAWMSLTGGFKEGSAAGKNDSYINDDIKKEVIGSKGALDEFKINPDWSDSATWSILGKRYKLILWNSAVQSNQANMSNGMRGAKGEVVYQYDPVWDDKYNNYDNELSSESREASLSFQDSTFNEVEDDLSSDTFLNKWQEYVQDAKLQNGSKGITPAMVFHEVLSNPKAEFRAMGVKFGISRNNCANLMALAQNELVKYDITNQDLMDAISKFGNKKIASYLLTIPSNNNIEDIVKENPKIDDQSEGEKVQSEGQNPPPKAEKKDTFKDKFAKLFIDRSAWVPHIRDVDIANYIYYWIESGFKTPDEVGKKFNIKKADAKWWQSKAIKLLKKYNLTEDDIKNAVKSYGKKAITDMIGKDN